MDFSYAKPRRQSEPALPMINVVFLLLIFFLMSAQIVAPPPIEVSPPTTAQGEPPREDVRLHISADGTLALDSLRGSLVWGQLAQTTAPEAVSVLIRADAALPAAQLARVMARLSGLGFGDVKLATVKP